MIIPKKIGITIEIMTGPKGGVVAALTAQHIMSMVTVAVALIDRMRDIELHRRIGTITMTKDEITDPT